MSDFEGVTHASGDRGDPVARQFHIKKFVHWAEKDHIRVDQHKPLVLDQAKDPELGPCVVEPKESLVESWVLACGGRQVWYVDNANTGVTDGTPADSRERVCCQDHERIG